MSGFFALAVVVGVFGTILIAVLLTKAKENGTIVKSTEDEDRVARYKFHITSEEALEIAEALRNAANASDEIKHKQVTKVLDNEVVQFEIIKG